ncbi:hypothetical protein [Caproicibacter fermentans]|uniref:Carrier domain-containing protein n=1 Tax=Caproicibacter fermentans TaxID=2576756 RepID=A0A7G8TC57_9FIRM|nr:hypothetical protein [Caproicibacter fermentans]QNK41198.1 hypothetical protein HCR03_02495 [Caproicibacter fermentans]
MNGESTEIRKMVINILYEKFDIPNSYLNLEYWSQPLTGNVFHFSGVDLTYLFFEVEKVYHIHINSSDLEDYAFSSINKISEIVQRYVS